MTEKVIPPTTMPQMFHGTIGGKTHLEWHQLIWQSVQSLPTFRDHYTLSPSIFRAKAGQGAEAFITLAPLNRRRSWSPDLITIRAQSSDERTFLPESPKWSVVGLNVPLASNVTWAEAIKAAEECAALEVWRKQMGDEHGELSEIGQKW